MTKSGMNNVRSKDDGSSITMKMIIWMPENYQQQKKINNLQL